MTEDRNLIYEYNDVEYDVLRDLEKLFDNPKEAPLSKDDHFKVVNDLGPYIEKMTPQEIPVFIYQLLKYCKHHNAKSIFLRLQNYFSVRIYNNANFNSDSNSESTNLDLIESCNEREIVETEGTVLFHIHNSASLGQECIREYLNSLKNLIKSPEFILHPFQLTVLFTISTIKYYEESVFDIIRPAVSRAYNEEQRKSHSCWYREMVPSTCKVEGIFSQVVMLSLEERELVIQGLVNFAFVLLGVGSALGRDPISEKQWNLGNMILFKIIKRKRHVASVIIKTISNCIITGNNVTHYIECLYILSRMLPLLMVENQSCIIELMEALLQVPGSTANHLLDVIIPLTKVSPTIRDHLILLLRKALYSRVMETRQMAVAGFLKLLTVLKISNLVALSQSSSQSGSYSSGHSLFTQISLNRSTQFQGNSFSNEALCLEVLGILKRCFMQQAEVRSQLYDGLYDAVCTNPELGIPVLDVVWFHFSEFYVIDEDTIPPLKFDKVAVRRDIDAVLQEPIGKLISAIGLILTKVSETEKDNSTVIKFEGIMQSICKRMINCELIHLELDDGTDLLDILPESQQKLLILKEAMSVYEALMGYKICSWDESSENNGQQINSLYQGYSRLVHLSKNLSKPKKAEKKKKDANKTTQPSQNNTTIRRDGAHKGSKHFKMPDTLMDFQTLEKFLQLLHEPQVSWTTATLANSVKTKREIHRHVMQATIHSVQTIKSKKVIDSQSAKAQYEHLVKIGTILYLRIIKRLEEFIDFDCTTAVLALECFHAVLLLISTQFKSNLVNFLKKVGDSDSEGLVANLTPFVEVYQKLFEIDEEEITDDPDIKRMSLLVITTLSVLTNQAPRESNPITIKIYDWLKCYAYDKTLPSKVATVFVNLFLETHISYKVPLTLFEHIAISLGQVFGVLNDEEEQTAEKFKIINEATAHTILLTLCSNVKSVLEDIEAVITRLKSEFSMITYPGAENTLRKIEYLKSKERGVSCQLCFVVNILTNMANISVQPGNVSEAIFKNTSALYNILATLTKYFMMRSSKVNPVFQGARFEHLVKLACKQLAPVIYMFILHIEESQKQETQNKKKTVDTSSLKSKVLRETRVIPKVIYEIEQFSKCVTQLSNKTKVDLSKYIGQGTVRDFRIMRIKEVLEQAGGNQPSTQQTEADTSVEQIESENNENESDVENSPPLTKRSRR